MICVECDPSLSIQTITNCDNNYSQIFSLSLQRITELKSIYETKH